MSAFNTNTVTVTDGGVAAPTISNFTPTSGAVNALVAVYGAHLSGVTAVKLNGTPCTFTVITDTGVDFTVPSGATPGTVSVTTPGSTATSSQNFPVTTPGGGGTPKSKINLVVDGDSRTYSPTQQNPWADQYRTKVPANVFTITDIAVGGTTSQQLIDRLPNTLPAKATDALNVYVVFDGVNDFHLNSSNRDPAPTIANLKTITQMAVAAGYLVVVCTSMQVGHFAGDYQPQLNAVNAAIRANYGAWGATAYVDLDKEYLLQNPLDHNVWLSDSLHLTAYGNTVIARAVKRVVDGVMSANGMAISPATWSADDCYEGGLASLAFENVVFTDLSSGTTASGNNLTLARGGTAHSTRAAGPSAAGVRADLEFTVPQVSYSNNEVWLSDSASANSDTSDSPFFLYFDGNGNVKPGGTYLGPYQDGFPYANGDVFRIQVERGPSDGLGFGIWSWYQNGGVRHSWLAPVPAGNLQVDSTGNDGGTIASVRLYGASLVNISASAGAATTTALTSSKNPSTHGNAVTLTAAVTSSAGTPTGSVAFMDGAATLGTAALSNGIATLALSSLTTATHALSAVYGGAGTTYASSSGNLS